MLLCHFASLKMDHRYYVGHLFLFLSLTYLLVKCYSSSQDDLKAKHYSSTFKFFCGSCFRWINYARISEFFLFTIYMFIISQTYIVYTGNNINDETSSLFLYQKMLQQVAKRLGYFLNFLATYYNKKSHCLTAKSLQ